MSKNLFILRGLPGSGKSTLAQTLVNGNLDSICEEDDYFYVNGEYKFDRTKIKESLHYCYLKLKTLIDDGLDTIVISNINIQLKDFEKYIDLAKNFGYNVTVMIVENYHGNISIHGVPESDINDMRHRFEISL